MYVLKGDMDTRLLINVEHIYIMHALANALNITDELCSHREQ